MKEVKAHKRPRTTKICPFMIIDLVNNLPFCSASNMALCDKKCREQWQKTSDQLDSL